MRLPTGRRRRVISALPQVRAHDGVHAPGQQVMARGNALPYGLGPGERRGGGRGRRGGSLAPPSGGTEVRNPRESAPTAAGASASAPWWRMVASDPAPNLDRSAYQAAEEGRALTADQKERLQWAARREATIPRAEPVARRVRMTTPRERIDARTGDSKAMDLRGAKRDLRGNLVAGSDPQLGLRWEAGEVPDPLAGLRHRREWLAEEARRRQEDERRRRRAAGVPQGAPDPRFMPNPFR